MGRGVMPRLPGRADGGETWDGLPTGYGELPAAMARCRLPAKRSRRAVEAPSGERGPGRGRPLRSAPSATRHQHTLPNR